MTSKSDNVILLNSDKRILKGEKDENDYKNFSNRKSQIRSRVNNRSEILAREIELLNESGEGGVVDNLVNELTSTTGLVARSELVQRVDEMERKLHEIERQCDELPVVQGQLQEVQAELGLEQSQ